MPYQSARTILARVLMLYLRRPRLFVLQAFSGQRLWLRWLTRDLHPSEMAAPVVTVVPRSLMRRQSGGEDRLLLSLSVELDMKALQAAGEPALLKALETWLEEDPQGAAQAAE